MVRFFLAIATAACLVAPAPAGHIPLSQEMTGGVSGHLVLPGETLSSIGSRVGVDTNPLARTNQMRGSAPVRAGAVLQIDNRHLVPVGAGSVVINVPQRMLFLIEEGQRPLAFPVGLGRRTWPTPEGRFTIVTKEVDPTWDVPISIQREMERAGRPPLMKVAPGPNNPLGDRWIGLSLAGIGIHGTNAPATIYHHQTHGCIRLHPEDIRAVFDRLAVSDEGEIVYQPLLLAVLDGRVYLESHPDVYHRMPKGEERLRATADAFGLTALIDWAAAIRVIRDSSGLAIDVSARR